MFLPYIGSLTRLHVPLSEILWYGGESQQRYDDYLSKNAIEKLESCDRVDGYWTYRFNSKGFRGDEYDARADFTLAIVGCSVGFGEAVPWDKTWGALLRKQIATQKRLENVVCLNFSQSGASNDYIARTAIRQCRHAAPSLLVVYFSHIARKEILDGDTIYSFGSWCADANELLQAQLGCYTNEEALLNTLKNILLVQDYCKQAHIPYLFVVQERKFFDDPKISSSDVFGDFYQLIDWNRIADFRMEWIDRARDNLHPGAISQRAFAEKLFSFYQKR